MGFSENKEKYRMLPFDSLRNMLTSKRAFTLKVPLLDGADRKASLSVHSVIKAQTPYKLNAAVDGFQPAA